MKQGNKVRVLFLDVETEPNLAFVWGKYEQNTLGDFVRERQIMCFSWSWLGESEIHALALPMFPGYRKDKTSNRDLIKRLHDLVSQADIVIGHNLQAFDDKMANTDFIVNGLPPPPPHKIVDTLKVARSRFRFNSNKLDDLGLRLGLGRKVHHRGFNMWLGCLQGDKRSWAEMLKYNIGDVSLLKKIYVKFRPWMTNHPNMAALEGGEVCPGCSSKRMIRRTGVTLRGTLRCARFSCGDCNKWSVGKYLKNMWRFS